MWREWYPVSYVVGGWSAECTRNERRTAVTYAAPNVLLQLRCGGDVHFVVVAAAAVTAASLTASLSFRGSLCHSTISSGLDAGSYGVTAERAWVNADDVNSLLWCCGGGTASIPRRRSPAVLLDP